MTENDYNDVIYAYKMLLHQLNNRATDERFFSYVESVYAFAQRQGKEIRAQMADEIYSAMARQDDVGIVISLYSFLLRLDENNVYMEEFLKSLRNLQKICYLEWQVAAYYYRQLNTIRLQQPGFDTENVRNLLSELVRRGTTSCMRKLNVAVRPVLYIERNKEKAIVLTEEFVRDGSEHMKQVLECCYKLQHGLGKQILLINTTESTCKAGEVSFFGAEYGNKEEGLGKEKQIEWKGEAFDFFQCDNLFVDMYQTEKIITTILDYKPGMVFHIGDNSFLAGIIDEWMPVMFLGGTYGKYPISAAEFQAAFESGQDLEEEFITVVKNYEETIQDERNLRVRLVFPADYFQDENRKVPHYEEGTWDSYTIHPGRKKIWAVQLSMLKEVIRICNKYNISYYAYKGTLLGAVRCKGFIPWDTDIDIAMKRKDYKKFREAAEKELDHRFCLMDASIVSQWEQQKIQILCRADVDGFFAGKKDDTDYLPSIDIAVLDYFPADAGEAEKRKDIFRMIYILNWRIDCNGKLEGHSILEFEELKQKLGYEINEDGTIKNQLVQLQQLTASQITDNAAGLFFVNDWRSGQIFQEMWFEEGSEMAFENGMIAIPHSYTEVLNTLYGGNWKESFVKRFTPYVTKEEEYLDLDDSLYDKEELKDYKENFFDEEVKAIHYTGFDKVEYFFIEKKMKCAWAASIKVLKEIEHVCKKHGILYFVDWGSLLGAVRHQGFIPWDDDIDIAMKREDYNRFMEIAKEEMPERYCLIDEVFEETWETNVSRVLNMEDIDHGWVEPHTEREEEFFGCPYIIGVDIYQLDYIPRDLIESDMQVDIFTYAIKIQYELKASNNEITEEIGGILKTLEEICNHKFIHDDTLLSQILQFIGAIEQMYGPDDADEVLNLYSRYSFRDRGMRKEWYNGSVSLPFETTTVEVPKEYMKVLLAECGKFWKVGYASWAHDYPFYKNQEGDLKEQGVSIS